MKPVLLLLYFEPPNSAMLVVMAKTYHPVHLFSDSEANKMYLRTLVLLGTVSQPYPSCQLSAVSAEIEQASGTATLQQYTKFEACTQINCDKCIDFRRSSAGDGVEGCMNPLMTI